MFGKTRAIKKTIFFLLQMDCSNHPWNIPENTLWLNFNDALAAAMRAVSAGAEEDEAQQELEIAGNTAFMWKCFEIMPISISEPNRITWLGKERKRNELHA